MKQPDTGPLYADARIYDLQHRLYMDDLPFYMHLIDKHGDPVLELMAGTGRLSIALAKAGVDVTALDYSREMLAEAEVKARKAETSIHLVHADCRTFTLSNAFKFIFIPFNSLSHVHDRESLAALFGAVSEHLLDDGRFVIDVFVPDMKILMRSDARRYPVSEFDDPVKGRIRITENNRYDPATQINRIKWYYEIDGVRDARIVENNMRIFYPEELFMMLECHGFAVENRYGNYDFSSFDSRSHKQLYVCKKK